MCSSDLVVVFTLGAGYLLYRYWYMPQYEHNQSILMDRWQREVMQQLPDCPYNGAWFFQKEHARSPFNELSQTVLQKLLTTKVDQSVPYLPFAINSAENVITKARTLDNTDCSVMNKWLHTVICGLITIVGIWNIYELETVRIYGYSIFHGNNPFLHLGRVFMGRVCCNWDRTNSRCIIKL